MDLASSLRFKTRSVFTASISEGKNPRFLAINHTEVSAPKHPASI